MAEGGEKRSQITHRTPSQIKRHTRTYGRKPSTLKKKRERARARYHLVKDGVIKEGDPRDVNHKKMLSKGGSNDRSNLEMQSASKNRGHGTSPGGRPKSRTVAGHKKRGPPKAKPKAKAKAKRTPRKKR